MVTGIARFILCILLVSPCAARQVDYGGRVDLYAATINHAKGVHRIAGDCRSACTMWLGYRESCVTRDARLWFHGSYELRTPRLANAAGNAEMMAFYPMRVKQIVSPWLETTQMPLAHSLSGSQLIALGVQECR